MIGQIHTINRYAEALRQNDVNDAQAERIAFVRFQHTVDVWILGSVVIFFVSAKAVHLE